MRINRGNKRLCFLVVCVLVFALVGGLALSAFAAEEQEVTSSFKKTWMNIWEVLNFLILAFLVFKLLKDPVRNFFQGRAARLREKIAEAEEASVEAERELEEVESRFEKLDEEIQKLQQTITEQGEKQRDKIIANAKQTADYMLEKAKLEADHSIQQARSQLRREVIDGAVMLAEENIRKAIDKRDQERLVDEYLRDLQQVPSSSV